MPNDLPRGFIPDAASNLPKGFVPDQQAQQSDQGGIVTPREGESFAETMQRGIEFGKTVTPKQIADSYHEGLKKVPTVLAASLFAGPAVIGAATAPQAVGAAAGGGVLGGYTGGATGGALMELINKTLHGAAGENVVTPQSGMDILKSSAFGGVTGAALGLFDKVATSKLSRGMINASVGATTRDVTYGNPAVGIVKFGVDSPFTGDLEAYKAALRSGTPPEQALVAAGGRLGQVAQNINRLSPQLDAALSKVTTPLKVADVIDKPLEGAMSEIIGNKAMTQAEKDAAVNQLGALQQSLKEGLGDTVTPLEANKIKQAIGNRINWAGNIAVTDEVKPAYRAVYSSLKNAVNKAVPGAAGLNEDLTNLIAAQTDLQKLMQAEETGQGRGALGSAVTGIARRLEASVGRILPLAGEVSKPVGQLAPTGGATIGEMLKAKGVSMPDLPFHPNQQMR